MCLPFPIPTSATAGTEIEITAWSQSYGYGLRPWEASHGTFHVNSFRIVSKWQRFMTGSRQQYTRTSVIMWQDRRQNADCAETFQALSQPLKKAISEILSRSSRWKFLSIQHWLPSTAILLSSSHLRLGLPGGLFPSVFPLKHIFTSSLPHTCHMPRPSHSSRYDHPNNIWWGIRSWNSLCSRFQSPLTSTQVGLNAFLSALLSQPSSYHTNCAA